MTHFADLDISVIDELPGRTPVDTRILNQSRATEITDRLDTQFNEGSQAYRLHRSRDRTICRGSCQQVEKLKQQLPHRRIGLIHGRMKTDEKSVIMAAFAFGDLDLLVATTVIEVGVNVPNASIMVIENPERLVLRSCISYGAGWDVVRVSYCILLAGDSISKQSRERLSLLKTTNDGFELAEADLRLRPGDVTGTRQTGELSFVADLSQHAHLLDQSHPSLKPYEPITGSPRSAC